MLDTSERDRALKELEEERVQSIKHKRDLAEARLEVNLLRSERDKLKHEVQDLTVKLEAASEVHPPAAKHDAGSSSDTERQMSEGKYSLLKNLCASQVRGRSCRKYVAVMCPFLWFL